MKSGKKLSKKEIAYYKKLLVGLRSRISGEVKRKEVDCQNKASDEGSGDEADMASDLSNIELNLGMASNEQGILNDIEDALKRIEAGTFGICEKYNIPITKSRLKAMPYVRYCLKAQEEEEKKRKK